MKSLIFAAMIANSALAGGLDKYFPAVEISSNADGETIEISSAFEMNQDLFAPYGSLNLKSSEKNRTYQFNFGKVEHKELNVLTKNQIKKYLKQTDALNYSDPVFEKFLKSVRVNENFDLKLTHMTQFIRDELGMGSRSQDANGNIFSAAEIFRQKLTECHQVSALYVALARGLGIPARIIYGVQFEPHPGKVLFSSLHAWVEVIESGKWRPLEPYNEDLQLENKWIYLPLEEDFLYSGLKKQPFIDLMIAR